MLGDLKTGLEKIGSLEKLNTDEFNALKDQIKSDTARQREIALDTTIQSLNDLQKLVQYIQEVDHRLLLGSSNNVSRRLLKAVIPFSSYKAADSKPILEKKLHRVICSFESSSNATGVALENVCQNQELVIDFQHSRIVPLKQEIVSFLRLVHANEQKNAEELKFQKNQLINVCGQIKQNAGEQDDARNQVDKRKGRTVGWSVVAGVSLLATPIGPIAAVAAGMTTGVAGIVALVNNDKRKDAERLVETLQRRKKDIEAKKTEIESRVEQHGLVKSDFQRIEAHGKQLESRTETLTADAREATYEIQCLKERTSHIAETFTSLCSKTVTPLLYCQTRQQVLDVLEEAFDDVKMAPMAEQARSIVTDVEQRVAKLKETRGLVIELEEAEIEELKKEKLRSNGEGAKKSFWRFIKDVEIVLFFGILVAFWNA